MQLAIRHNLGIQENKQKLAPSLSYVSTKYPIGRVFAHFGRSKIPEYGLGF
jgi:hypothetical protein